MPMGLGVHYVGSEGVAISPFYSILWMIIWIAIIAVILYILISPLKKQSNAIDNEKLIKIEKDVEEIKEIVRELKKKWEEIE
ncbi:hypothetical protein JH146_1572 [Methanocaldococcus bathoardescens]|uniref:Uncharacterized protein n=1 Tax=Methanocaldococcus bathoardescens TaxID=1301915 RepID=A0A076LL79_9EURY|nr:hypothetical protein [Methanocaldococcus bathoardescens]AIJ06414.1 hypothetical protein JH146_1572 [Methanocaldococcus bathoardescens]